MAPQFPILLAVGDKTRVEADLRRQLHRTVAQYPGLHAAELARRTGVKEPSARYHLRMMVRLGLANEVEEAGYLRYYPAGTTEPAPLALGRNEKRALAILRRPVPLRIVLALLGQEEPRGMGWIAEQAGVANGTATYHVKNLHTAEIVEIQQRHRERLVHVRDPDWVIRLLTHYPPPRDVVEGFVELWDQLEL